MNLAGQMRPSSKRRPSQMRRSWLLQGRSVTESGRHGRLQCRPALLLVVLQFLAGLHRQRRLDDKAHRDVSAVIMTQAGLDRLNTMRSASLSVRT